MILMRDLIGLEVAAAALFPVDSDAGGQLMTRSGCAKTFGGARLSGSPGSYPR